jgi:hypothetical protein
LRWCRDIGRLNSRQLTVARCNSMLRSRSLTYVFIELNGYEFLISTVLELACAILLPVPASIFALPHFGVTY